MKLTEKAKQSPYGDRITIERSFHPTFEGELAIKFVERWGMVMAEDGGEDSMGRAKVRSAAPEEIVARAFKTASLVVKKLQDDDLLIPVPELKKVA